MINKISALERLHMSSRTLLVTSVAMLMIGAVALQPLAVSAADAPHCNDRVFRQGNVSHCVKYIQTMLNGISYEYAYRSEITGDMLASDGIFGAKTTKKIKQAQNFGDDTRDGVVGRQTWTTLCFLAGQYGFKAPGSSSYMKSAWNAAYDAGCEVEYDWGKFKQK